mgnify:CR=1 FL=1
MFAFKVPDMTCGHCVKAITAAVTAIDGRARIDVDLSQRLVSVETGTATAAQVQAAITDAGYSPVPASGATPG